MTTAFAPAQSGSGAYPDLPVEPSGWRADGHCTRSALEFSPAIEVGGRIQVSTAQQRAQCVGCPVMQWCALDALKRAAETGSLDGVWAGLASSITMKRDSYQSLIDSLADIAGLPEGHYLRVTGAMRRRRRHVEVLYRRGLTAEQIAYRLELSTGTVDRDIASIA